MKNLVLLPLLALSAFAFARVDSVEIVDKSDLGSPIQIKGTVLVSESFESSTSQQCANLHASMCAVISYREQVSQKVISSKPIVALVIHTDIGTQSGLHPVDETLGFDRLLGQLLMPGQEVEEGSVRDSGAMFLPVTSMEQNVKPTAETRVLFAQFADGTTFGDKKHAEHLLNLRRRTLQLLRQLDKICSSGDEQQCPTALAGITDDNPFIANLQRIQRSYDGSRLIKEIHDSLSRAEERLSKMAVSAE